MTIAWNDAQRAQVEHALAAHPKTSPRCADAARAILPVALERDTSALALLVEPALPFARYVLPKHQPRPEWHHHVLVHTESHGVDALTGPDGLWFADYLSTYFEHPQAHAVTVTDLQQDSS
jgi:hypothetical protein